MLHRVLSIAKAGVWLLTKDDNISEAWGECSKLPFKVISDKPSNSRTLSVQHLTCMKLQNCSFSAKKG